MENPAQGGVSESRTGKLDTPESARSTYDPQAACRAIAAGLVYLPDACDMAAILRRRLDLQERIWLATGSILSLPEAAAEDMSRATIADIEAHRRTPHEREVERQRAAWRRHCADPKQRARR